MKAFISQYRNNHANTITRESVDSVGFTVVPNGSEVIGGGVGGEPLLDGKERLSTVEVGPSGGDLDVVALPAVVRAGAVGGEVHCAERGSETRSCAAEDVEVTPLKVIVVGAHPGFKVRNPSP